MKNLRRTNKSHKFSIIEMMVVISVILILGAMLFLVFRTGRNESKKLATKNLISMLKTLTTQYLTDYRVLPTPGHVDPSKYNDSSGFVDYWDRTTPNLYNVNNPQGTEINGKLEFDIDNSDMGTLKSEGEFHSKYPSKDLVINAEPWNSTKDVTKEKVSVISHSSRFLNYYLSGSNMIHGENTTSYWNADARYDDLGTGDTTFKLPSELSVLVRPFQFMRTDVFEIWHHDFGWSGSQSGKYKVSTIPTVKSALPNKTIIFYNYVYKSSENVNEENLRRLYIFNDTPVVHPADGITVPEETLKSDKARYVDSRYFQKGSQYGQYQNNRCVRIYMHSAANNVRMIQDSWGSPLVYITATNQLRESAATYQDGKNDISLRDDAFLIYSLGENKADDSNLGENLFDMSDVGDDFGDGSSGRMNRQ